MISFQTNGRHQDVFRLFTPQVIAQEGQYRPDTFAAYCKYILYGFVERSGLAVVSQTCKIVVDLLQDFVG